MKSILGWLEAVAARADDAIVAKSSDGKVFYWNREAASLFGYSAEEALGRPLRELLPPLHTDDTADAWCRRAERGEAIAGVQQTRIAKGGRLVPVRLEIDPVVEDGSVRGCVIRFRDVERQQETLRRMNHADRLATIGTLVATVAHEMSNPLGLLLATAELLEAETPTSAPYRELVDNVRLASNQLCRIVADLRTYSARDSARHERTDLAEVVEMAVRLSGVHVRARARLVLRVRPGVVVLGDPPRLAQVIVNLLNNAADAVTALAHEARTIVVELEAEPPGAAVMRVKDNGPGIPDGDRHRVFEPFFTTKQLSGGTGLGLAISRTIAEEHGGTLTLEGGEEGTTFALRIPLADAKPS